MKSIAIGNHGTINIHTMNVKEVGEVMRGLNNYQPTGADLIAQFDTDIMLPETAVLLATGLTADELGAWLPEDIPALWRAVAEENDFLLRTLRKRLGGSQAPGDRKQVSVP